MDKEKKLDLSAFSNLIGLIYDTAQQPELWPELLEKMCAYNASMSATNQTRKTSKPKLEENLNLHFTQALNMSQQAEQLASKNETTQEILNHLPMGVMMINHEAKPYLMNAHAKTILAKSHLLCIKNEILQAHTPHQTHKLHELIHAYTQGVKQDVGASLLIHDDNTAISIWISPPETTQDKLPRHVALYIASTLISPNYNAHSIQQDFGLTPAEARLTQVLSNGSHDLNAAAKKLGISIHTARTQIKVVYEKTNTHSQLELIKKVLTSASAMIAETQPAHATSPNQFQYEHKAQQLLLQDGRYLGYVEYGDPKGEPIIYCHSMIQPDHQLFYDPELQHHIPFRIISPKRPGYLDSSETSKPYHLNHHANDIIQLADILGLENFKVIGHSNGGPYATALAHDFPNRVTKLILISPFVPPEMDKLSQLKSIDKYMYQFGKYMPESIINHTAHIMFKSFVQHPYERLEKNMPSMSDSEKAFVQSPELRRTLKQWTNESFPHRVKAITHDLFVRIRPWHFHPSNIQVPVTIWHAEDDSFIPIDGVKDFAATMPHCTTHWIKKGGHYIFHSQIHNILHAL